MIDRPLRGVVAGLGVMGSHHVRVLSTMENVEISAVVDPDDARRTRGARAARAAAYASLGEALERERPDFVCVAVPVAQLASVAHEAIDTGIATLVEKPLAATEQEAVGVIRAAEKRGALLSVGHVERFNPAVLALKAKLTAGDAGRIYQMHARRLSPYPDRATTPVGVSRDLATHDVDVMRFVLESEVRHVYAEVARRSRSEIDDLVSGSLRFEDGTTGVLEVNWLTPTKVREFTVTSENGMFVVNYLTQDLRFYAHPREAVEWDTLGVLRGSGEGDMMRFGLERREPLLAQWEAFVHAVRTNGRAPVPGDDGYAALSIACALERSGEAGTAIVPGYRAGREGIRR